LDRKSNNKVSKCKFKKNLFGNKTKEFRYLMTIANQNAGFALLGDTNTKQPPSGKWIVA